MPRCQMFAKAKRLSDRRGTWVPFSTSILHRLQNFCQIFSIFLVLANLVMSLHASFGQKTLFDLTLTLLSAQYDFRTSGMSSEDLC